MTDPNHPTQIEYRSWITATAVAIVLTIAGTATDVVDRVSPILLKLAIPSALADSGLNVTSQGVGIGTETPSRPLHIVRDGNGAETVPLLLDNPTGKVRFLLRAGDEAWTFDNTGANSFAISRIGTGVNELLVSGNGNLVIQGTLTEGSSRKLKDGIVAVDNDEILAAIADLPIFEWHYTAQEDVRHVGPMAEDFHQVLGLGPDPSHIAPRDLAGVAIASTKALHGTLKEQKRLLAERDAQIQMLQRRIERLEDALGLPDK